MKLIKNNLKLMFRCKPLVLFVIGLVIVTGMLSAVFKDFMINEYEIEGCTAGYSFTTGCAYEPIKPIFESVCEENDIETANFVHGSAENAVESGRADVFVEFTDDGYTVYSDSDHETQASIMKMLVSSIISGASGEQAGDYVTEYEIDVLPMPDSEQYYTIAYTVYFTWIAMIVLAIVTSSERKNKISARFRTTPASSLSIYMSRFVPSAVMITLLIGAGVVLCTLVYGIEWMEIPTTALILFLGCVAAAAVATVLFSLIKNVIVAIAVGFCITMFCGFFGGSFCAYMYATFAYGIRDFSPIYYMTRSIVELNTSGSSEFTIPAILVLCGMSIVCIPLGMLAVKTGKEG